MRGMKRIWLAAGVCAAGLGLAVVPSAGAARNAAVAAVSADGNEISVSGVSAGNTEVVIQTASGELQVPVQVGDGG